MMKTFKLTLAVSTLVVGLGITNTAMAQQTEAQQALTQFVTQQGQQVAKDIAKQVNQNLKNSIASYLKNSELTFEGKQQAIAKTTQSENKTTLTTTEDE